MLKRAVVAFSSQKLAVVLLVTLGLLTWLGTLAQIEGGLWATQKEYFESWGLIAELPLSWWGSEIPSAENQWVIKIPLPGAYPVMMLLFLNLLVGGMVRLKWRARNAGVLITHIGIALLLLAGFVKMEYSYSGALALYETPTSGPELPHRQYESSTFVSFHDYELALMKDDGDTLTERVVPEAKLQGAIDDTVTLSGEGLPFELHIHHYLVNCRPLSKGPMVNATTPVLEVAGGGPGVYLQPLEVNAQREQNRAGVYVRVMVRGQQHAEGIIWGPNNLPVAKIRFPFVFELEGARWAVDLRKVMYELPFSMRLSKFVKRDHPGTTTPADFRSWVLVGDGSNEREVQIYMNTPLRQDGYVAYQTSWGPQQPGADGRLKGPPWFSIFEVAANPSDQWPMWSCWVIGLGLFVHMFVKLLNFLKSSARTNLTA
ncbi:MAG: hypothetical protein ACI89X_003546 [Planctomycetota bacterium]|jgi:hypothetical protein